MLKTTTEVSPGMTLIALVSNAPRTRGLKELSLAINTPEGIVLKQAFGDRYLYAGLGTVLELGATSPASSAQTATSAREK